MVLVESSKRRREVATTRAEDRRDLRQPAAVQAQGRAGALLEVLPFRARRVYTSPRSTNPSSIHEVFATCVASW